MRGAVLGSGELLGAGRIDEVRSAHGAEKDGPSGEHGDGLAVDGHGIGEMGRSVAGRVDGGDGEAAGRDHLAVVDAVALEVNRVLGVDDVGGAGPLGERESAGDVVVVATRVGEQRAVARQAGAGDRTALLTRIQMTPRQLAAVITTGTAVGFLTGLFGVGGGFVIVPALTLVLGFNVPQAVGTSLLVIPVNALAALAARDGPGRPPPATASARAVN